MRSNIFPYGNTRNNFGGIQPTGLSLLILRKSSQVADDGTVDTSSTPIYAYFTIYADKATYGSDGYADHQTVELDSKTGTQSAKLDNGNYVEVTVGAKLTCL